MGLGQLGGECLADVLGDLAGHREKGVAQDSVGVATKAPMIKAEFGELVFENADALEVQRRFNALHGSNT